MPKTYRTANGKTVNMDALMAMNEQAIAVGNMDVNARGDKLGPGGRVVQTKDQVMSDYYKLNTPVAEDNPPLPQQRTAQKKDLTDDWEEPEVAPTENPVTDGAPRPKLRGSLADALAAKTTVENAPPPPRKKPERF